MNNTFLEIFTLRIKSMQQAAKLLESEERYRDLFENATDLIQSTTPDGHFIYVNRAWRGTLGYSEKEVRELTFSDIVHPDSQTQGMEVFNRLISGEKVERIETVFVTKRGKKVVVEGSVSCRYKDGKPISTRGIFRDISARHRAHEKIKEALREKEVLLKEIHHRVKNNLQIIVSLLSLQSEYIEDKQALDVYKNSQERVRAMALIHEKLYESKDLVKVDFHEYIQSLITYLFDSYSLKTEQVLLKIQIDDVSLNIETAIPLGLLINELVSNSLKHAFPSGRKGALLVNLWEIEDEEYDYTLIVEDNGVGLPDSLDFQDSNSLGMVLVYSLVKRLKGVIDLDRKDGARFTVKFKKLVYKKRV
jgi:PAS domain S-box-containing protein